MNVYINWIVGRGSVEGNHSIFADLLFLVWDPPYLQSSGIETGLDKGSVVVARFLRV